MRNNQISDLDPLSNMKNTTTKYVDMRFNEMNISEDSWDLTIIEYLEKQNYYIDYDPQN